MATPQQIAITQLYTALFNRAPDAAGLAFWEQALLNGASLDTIAQGFLTSPESLAIYPASGASSQFVAQFYTTVFGRAPDAEGQAFWTAALDAQGGAGSPAARAALVRQIVEIVSTPMTSKSAGISDEAYAQTVADRGRFINKTDVGVYFATELKSDDHALAAKVLAAVTHEPASVTAAREVAVGTPTAPGGSTGGGGGGGVGGGGVTPPAGPPVFTNADAVEAIRAGLIAYTGEQATVDAAGMDEAKLIAVASFSNRLATNGIKNLSLQLDGTTLPAGAVDALLRKAEGTMIDVTGGGILLRNVSELISHVADEGLTGTMQIDWTIGSAAIAPLLSAKLSSSAQVRVDAFLMGSAHYLSLAANIDKVDAIDNLSIRWDWPSEVMTDETMTALLTKATNPKFTVYGATVEHLHLIAARIIAGKPTAISDSVDLNRTGFSAVEMTALLSKMTGMTNVLATGLDTAQLAGLAVHADKINLIKDASLVLGDAAMTDELTAVLLPKLNSSNVDLTGASAAEFRAVVQAVNTGAITLSGNMALDSSVGYLEFSRLFMQYTGNSATVNASGLGPLHVIALESAVGKIAVGGITGDLNFSGDFNTDKFPVMMEKTSIDANVTVDATGLQPGRAQLLVEYIAKVDQIKNLPIWNLGLGWATEEIGTTLLSKAVDAKFSASGATAKAIELFVANIDKVAAGGVTEQLTLNATQFSGIKAALDAKLGTGARLVVTGTAGRDEVDLSALSHDTSVTLGAGADLVLAGNGNDTIRVGNAVQARDAMFSLTDTSFDHILQIRGLSAGDKMDISTVTFGNGPGVYFIRSSTTVALKAWTYTAADNANVSIQDVFDFLNAKTGADATVASTTAMANVYAVTIEGGTGLSGTLLVLNNGTAEIDASDLLVGITGTVTEQSFSFIPL